jgi:Fe-S cluster biogenesis protein NfuA
MVKPGEERDFRERVGRIETLIHGVERFADPAAQAHTRELVKAILDLHAVGLETVLGRLAEAGEPGRALLEALAHDDLVGSLLLLHGLHPLDTETRVRQALDQARPALRAHGGEVDLLAVVDGVVRLRLRGSCHGCPSSGQTLKQTIEEAVYDRAPEVTAVEVEGLTESPVDEGRRTIALPVVHG